MRWRKLNVLPWLAWDLALALHSTVLLLDNLGLVVLGQLD